MLIDYGFSHMQATGILVSVNVVFILLVFSLNQALELHLLLGLVIFLASALTFWLHKAVLRKKQEKLMLQ